MPYEVSVMVGRRRKYTTVNTKREALRIKRDLENSGLGFSVRIKPI